MTNIKKISAVRRRGFDPSTVQGSLANYNLTRFPGTIHKQVPYLELDGTYRTGLDPNAYYIKQLPKEEQEQEIARVNSYLEKLKSGPYQNIDIGPRSAFYSKMFDERMGEPDRCPVSRLLDGDNLFDIDIPEDLIKFAYLRVHPEIAPSLSAINTGYYTKAKYYVNDSEVEDDVAFKKKQKINKAIGLLALLSLEKQRKIGRQLGLDFRDDTKEATVYARLDEYIKASEDTKTSGNADRFLNFVEMNDDNLAVRDTVTQALSYNVLRKDKSGEIYRGKSFFAKSEEDAINILSEAGSAHDLEAIEDDIKRKKVMKK